MKHLPLHLHLRLLLLASVMLPACAIDRSIHVAAGEQRGTTRVIDGNIVVDGNAEVAAIRVIDGNATLHENSAVARSLHITDGELTMHPGATIGGDVVAHHATVHLDGARIDGDVELFCVGGTIVDSRVPATVRVRKKALWHVRCDTPRRLVIGAGSALGTLIVDDETIDVVVSESATIGQFEAPAPLRQRGRDAQANDQ